MAEANIRKFFSGAASKLQRNEDTVAESSSNPSTCKSTTPAPTDMDCAKSPLSPPCPADEDNAKSKKTASGSLWCRGCKVNVPWLVQTFPTLVPVKLGKRNRLKCSLCFHNITEAQKAARNGTVPIADGVRCDKTKAIERVIDHMKGKVHSAAERAQISKDAWTAQSDSHPWVKVMKTHQNDVVQLLIRLAVDVHNDSVVKTLSGWSWPSRYLAQRHADNQISQYVDHGLDANFVPYTPHESALHYISPDAYAEMLDNVAEIELESLKKKLVQSDCFSIQLDKSVDKYNIDSLFGTIRFLDVDYSMSVGLVGECHSEQRGAEGMMAAFTERLASVGLSDIVVEKMVGLMTDGESANMGKKSGLWARMSQHLGRG